MSNSTTESESSDLGASSSASPVSNKSWLETQIAKYESEGMMTIKLTEGALASLSTLGFTHAITIAGLDGLSLAALMDTFEGHLTRADASIVRHLAKHATAALATKSTRNGSSMTHILSTSESVAVSDSGHGDNGVRN